MTSRPIASKAGRLLRATGNSSTVKSVAASDLAQVKPGALVAAARSLPRYRSGEPQPGALGCAARRMSLQDLAQGRFDSSCDWATSILDPALGLPSPRHNNLAELAKRIVPRYRSQR
jgi:hypothetical protein